MLVSIGNNAFALITVCVLLFSCSSQLEKPQHEKVAVSAATKDHQKTQHSDFDDSQNEVFSNGTYSFDVAFAEWQGKSMGVKVTVIVSGDSIKVIYDGHGTLSAQIGEVLDEGLVMKHKSGNWIIGTQPSDKDLDEIGGCTGGPAIIDFKNKKYWMC
ncbi:MAG: hypothetical protein ACI9JN_002357 [Bacteroidia bacterium]